MPKQIEFDGTVHEFPDDFTDADIAAALGGPAPALPSAAMAGMLPQNTASEQPSRNQPFQSLGIETIPDDQWARMSTGEKMRGLLTAGGKALGTAFGLGEDPVDSPGMTLASAVVPPVAEKALGAVGKGAYRAGVALLPRTLKNQHPGIVARGFAEGIPLTSGGKTTAQAMVSGSRSQADDMILAAERAGAPPVRPMEVVKELREVGGRMEKQAAMGKPNLLPGLVDRAKGIIDRGPMALTRAQSLKREMQQGAREAYSAANRGTPTNALDTLADKNIATGLRQALETRVPGLQPVNERTKELLGVLAGADHASSTMHVLPRMLGAIGMAGATGGAGALPAAAAGIGGGLLTVPGGMTATGVALKNAAPYSAEWLRALVAASLANQPDQ